MLLVYLSWALSSLELVCSATNAMDINLAKKLVQDQLNRYTIL